MSSLKRKLITGGLWAASGRLISGALGLAISAMLARLLAPDDLGRYFLIFSLVTLFSTLAQGGLSACIVRILGEDRAQGTPGRSRQAIRLGLRLTALSAALTAALFVLGLGDWLGRVVFNAPVIAELTPLVALLILCAPLQVFITESFRGLQAIHLATLLSALLSSLLNAAAIVSAWWLYHQADLQLMVELGLFATVGAASISAFFLWLRLPRAAADRSMGARELLTMAWPMWIIQATYFFLSQADLWIVGATLDKHSVAIYGAVVELAALIILPLTMINAVIPSNIAELHVAGDMRRLEKMIRGAATLVALPALVIYACYLLFGGALLGIIYGDFYAQGALLLALLASGNLLNALTGSCGLTLMMTGHQKTVMLITVGNGLLALTSAALLVRHYGAVAVAASYALSMASQNILMTLAVQRRLGIWTHVRLRDLLRPNRLLSLIRH
ncbi:MAG: oligosaccharide flippase family protein [Gammaproteobacteria bacterium]|nr:oligosaccharide flippase family protein [Gammaproteobacteria bacterium]